MRIGMCVGMCRDMCIGMCRDMCICMCKDMCTDMCTDTCTDTCTGMCRDISTDMCISMCIAMAGSEPSTEYFSIANVFRWRSGDGIVPIRLGIPGRDNPPRRDAADGPRVHGADDGAAARLGRRADGP